jgi:hypothetical protein
LAKSRQQETLSEQTASAELRANSRKRETAEEKQKAEIGSNHGFPQSDFC